MLEEQGQDLFVQKRMELMVTMANQKVLSEIQQLKQVINELQQDVGMLKKRALSMPQQTAPPVQQQQPQPEQKPVQQQAAQSQDSRDQPRYGNFNSSDVSVEKFFYFGNKK